MQGRRSIVLAMLAAVLVAAALAPSAAAGGDRKKPARVLIIMLDQARPDTIERYGMENVKELMRRGASFPNALVGHMAAETTVSHMSLGGIDKLGHMWGPEDMETGPPRSDEEIRHLPFVAKNADVQVGRILGALGARRLLDETLIVVTADHAAQTGRSFHGRFDGFPPPDGIGCDPATGSTGLRSDCNWYYGRDADEVYLDPSPAIAAFRDALTPPGGVTNLRFSYQDGHVGAWLNDNSPARKREAAAAALDLPDVIASFHLNRAQDNYRLFGTNPMSREERTWFRRHGEELVDTMAAPYGPDVTALLDTDVTYGVMGDHGGHNRLIQSIPMIFYGPGVGSRDPRRPIRLVDVVPTILDTMGIAYDRRDLDGRAVRLPRGR